MQPCATDTYKYATSLWIDRWLMPVCVSERETKRQRELSQQETADEGGTLWMRGVEMGGDAAAKVM